MQFDGKISLGNIFTVTSLAVGLGAGYASLQSQIEYYSEKLENQKTELSGKIEMVEVELLGKINTRNAVDDANMRAIRKDLSALSTQIGQLQAELRQVLRERQ